MIESHQHLILIAAKFHLVHVLNYSNKRHLMQSWEMHNYLSY